MNKPLAQIIMELAQGKEIVIDKKDDGTVIQELFIQDGKMMVNELKRPGSEDPYDQREVNNVTALTYINWILD